jgi:hypothetical protein
VVIEIFLQGNSGPAESYRPDISMNSGIIGNLLEETSSADKQD